MTVCQMRSWNNQTLWGQPGLLKFPLLPTVWGAGEHRNIIRHALFLPFCYNSNGTNSKCITKWISSQICWVGVWYLIPGVSGVQQSTVVQRPLEITGKIGKRWKMGERIKLAQNRRWKGGRWIYFREVYFSTICILEIRSIFCSRKSTLKNVRWKLSIGWWRWG